MLDSSASSKHNDSHVELPIPELKTGNGGDIDGCSPTTTSLQAYQRTFEEDQEPGLVGDDQKFSLKSMDAIKIPSSRLFANVDDLHQAARAPAVIQGLNNSGFEISSSKQWHAMASDTNSTSSGNICLSTTSDQAFNCSISSSNHDDHYALGTSTSASPTPESSDKKSQFLGLKGGDYNDAHQERDLIDPDEGNDCSRPLSTHSGLYDNSIIFGSSKNLTGWPELVQNDASVNQSNRESGSSGIDGLAHCKNPPRGLMSGLTEFTGCDTFPTKSGLSLPRARSFEYQPGLNRSHTENVPSSLAIVHRNGGHDGEDLTLSDITTSETITTTILSQDSPFSLALRQASSYGLQRDNDSSFSNSNEISASTQAQLSETMGPQFSINGVDLRHRPSCFKAGGNAADPRLLSTQATDSEIVIQNFKRRNVRKLPLIGPLLYREKRFDSSVLFESVKSGNTTTLERLLDVARVHVNTRNESSMTLQMQAAVHGQLGCLHILRCRGADETAVDLKERTVLHLAVEAKQIDAVSWLLRAYASPSEDLNHKSPRFLRVSGLRSRERLFKGFLNASDKKGFKPLHVAARVNFEKVVRLLVEAGSSVNARNKRDRTPLHEAILSNSYAVASALLSNGAHVNAVTLDQMSSLHLVAYSGNHQLVPLLINKGANKLSYDSSGSMPIHQAAWGGHLKAIEELVGERPDLTVKPRFGGTLLHIAVFRNNIHLAQYLLQHNVDVNTWATFPHTYLSAATQHEMQNREISTSWLAKLESTPLHYSCYFGDFRLTSLLLKHGALPNAPIDDGMTSLMMAIDAENLDLVCLLLSYGARVNASVPVTCLTALHLASARGNELIVKELIGRGATINAILYAQGAALLTPLEYAIKILITKPESFANLTAIIRCFVQIDGTQLERAINFVRLWLPAIGFSVTLSKYLNSQHLRDIATASRNQSFVN